MSTEHSTWSARVDPTDPARWPRVRAMGKTAFLLKYGVLAAGVPLVLALNLFVIWIRGDLDLLFSVRTSFELAFALLLVAPLGGALVGNALWARGERRSGRDVVIGADQRSLPASMEVDSEQRRLQALKTHLDELARTAPQRLFWRMIGMTMLGYGYVLLVLGTIVAGVIWLRSLDVESFGSARLLSQLLIWLGIFVLSALWVGIMVPTGRRITRAGSPALFDLLEKVQRSLDAPSPDVVLLDTQLNASVTEIPRFGIFGLPKRYLVIGLPLLEALPSDECMAILAHELAHLSRRHGRRLMWTARLSVTWQNLAASLAAGRHWGRSAFLPFFRWYAPRFELHAQVVSRRDEHEADALSAECVGPAVAARAILRLSLSDRFLTESVMPAVLRRSADLAQPPVGAFESMTAALRAGPSREDATRWIGSALTVRTLDQDTHPSLADRVANLGVELGEGDAAVSNAIKRLFGVGVPSGAEHLIGERRLPKLRAQLDEDWHAALQDDWRRLHTDALVWREAHTTPGAPTFEASWARARWASACEPDEIALELVRAVLRQQHDHHEATVTLAVLLARSEQLEHRDQGLQLLEGAVLRESRLALIACEALESLYARRGRGGDVERVQTRARQLRESLLKGISERRELRVRDRLVAYPVPAPTLDTVRKACASQREVRRAYLVRKETTYLRDQPCVMLAVECGVPWYKPADGDSAARTCQAIVGRVVLPEAADLVVLPVAPRSRLIRRLRSTPGAEVYRRD